MPLTVLPDYLHAVIIYIQDELQFPLSFEWKKRSNLPYGAQCYYPCVLDGKIYISTGSRVLEYTPDTDTWVELPTLDVHQYYGMLSLNGKVTVVSGVMKESEGLSREIYVWDPEIQQWTKPYPLMTMGRMSPGCASYQHYLIVAGGSPAQLLQLTTSVEILDTRSGQWYKAPPMPYDGYHIRPVVIGKTLYLLFTIRGLMIYSKSILSVSLPTLISHAMQGKNCDASIWENLPDVPFYDTSLFSISNMLLTAGGSQGGMTRALLDIMQLKRNKPSADIYLFNPHINQWVKVGELPEARWACSCAVLPSGELLVAGGSYGERAGQELSTVYTATIS